MLLLADTRTHAVFFMLVFSPVPRKLFDSYGPRLAVLVGSVMHVFGLMMTSISHQVWFRKKQEAGLANGEGLSPPQSTVITS